MGKIVYKKYNPSVLRNAVLIRQGKGYMNTYLLDNGLIYKEIRNVDDSLSHFLQIDDFIDCLSKKLYLSSELTDEYLVLPKIVYLEHDRLKGYTVPYIKLDSFENLLTDATDFDFIVDSFTLLSSVVKRCNKDGIIFPDLGNASNILFDPKNRIIKFIDFDGLQIGDLDSFSVSSLMNNSNNPVFEQKKYFNKQTTLFTPEFDKASLLALFLYFTTGTFLTKFDLNDFDNLHGNISLKKDSIDRYLLYLGLLDSPLEEDISLAYNNDAHNKYPETSIKRLLKSHDYDYHNLRFSKK